MEVDVEVLDVSDDEARTLLLSLDPLAALAETQTQLRDRLRELAPPVPEELQAAWQAAAEASLASPAAPPRPGVDLEPAQFFLLVTCRDEQHQVAVLERLADVLRSVRRQPVAPAAGSRTSRGLRTLACPCAVTCV
jgi:hypothetical protein